MTIEDCKTCEFFHGGHGVICAVHPMGRSDCDDRIPRQENKLTPDANTKVCWTGFDGTRRNAIVPEYSIPSSGSGRYKLPVLNQPIVNVVLQMSIRGSSTIDLSVGVEFISDGMGDRIEMDCRNQNLNGCLPATTVLWMDNVAIAMITFPDLLLETPFRFYRQRIDRWFDGVLGDHSLVERSS